MTERNQQPQPPQAVVGHRMDATFTLIGIAFLGIVVSMTCCGPRYLGGLGLLGAHLGTFFAYLLWAGCAAEAGHYEYDGMLSSIGLTIQAFLLNCLFLPLGVFALERRWTAHQRRARQPSE